MALVSENWGELVEPLANRGFWTVGYAGGDRRESFLPLLFNMQGSQFAEEKSLGIGGLSAGGWNFEDTGRVQYADVVKGYQETFAHKQFAKGVMIERKLFDDQRWGAILNQTATLGDAAFRMREKAGANIFVNAFSGATSETLDDYGTDATGPDGVALCSAAHPRNSKDATTDANEGTESLTALRYCLGKLKQSDRLLVLTHYQHGKSLAKCSSLFGRSVSSLGVSLFRLRAALRRCIQSELAIHEAKS